jgi:hypothetical protein
MSVYFQTVVLCGWSIGTDTYKEFDPDPDEDEWENRLEREYSFRDADDGDIAVIYDGRSGRYCYFGEIVATTNSTRNGEQSFDNRLMIEGEPSDQMWANVRAEANEAGLDPQKAPCYHIFTHVT